MVIKAAASRGVGSGGVGVWEVNYSNSRIDLICYLHWRDKE